jgi:hypothetical protein
MVLVKILYVLTASYCVSLKAVTEMGGNKNNGFNIFRYCSTTYIASSLKFAISFL